MCILIYKLATKQLKLEVRCRFPIIKVACIWGNKASSNSGKSLYLAHDGTNDVKAFLALLTKDVSISEQFKHNHL